MNQLVVMKKAPKVTPNTDLPLEKTFLRSLMPPTTMRIIAKNTKDHNIREASISPASICFKAFQYNGRIPQITYDKTV